MNGATMVLLMAGGPAGQGGGGGGPTGMLVYLLLFGAIFYFMLIRPQQRKEKERKQMLAEIKSGARVMFGGGILGTVTNVKDTTITIKIADGVKVEVVRGAVSRVLEKGEKAEEDGAA